MTGRKLAGAIADIEAQRRLDLSGAAIKARDLDRILAAAPREGDQARLTDVLFDGATFGDGVAFVDVTFAGEACFREATFAGDAVFKGWFNGEARFDGAIFEGVAAIEGGYFREAAHFERVEFRGGVAFLPPINFLRSCSFEDAKFVQWATFGASVVPATAFFRWTSFRNAVFGGPTAFLNVDFKAEEGPMPASEAWLKEARDRQDALFGAPSDEAYEGAAIFRRAKFEDDVRFEDVSFEVEVDFQHASFQGRVDFESPTFEREASFSPAAFERAARFGRALALEAISFDGASFAEDAEIEISANRISCERTRFLRKGNLRVRWADVDFEEVRFDESATLAKGSRPLPATIAKGFRPPPEARLEEKIRFERARGETSARSERPRLVSLRGADVANLLLSDVDLRPCLFSQTHHLDGLRLEGDTEFGRSPRRWRWSPRQVLAEERQWRRDPRMQALRPGKPLRWWQRRRNERWRAEWHVEQVEPPRWLLQAHGEIETPRHPRDIAGMYRQLRKGREDNKDVSGAGDFYYGEMEMRRQDADAPLIERAVLWLYWLVSGYGLRASRALVALGVTILAFALGLWQLGFEPRPAFIRALLFSTESTSGLFRVPETPGLVLTYTGEMLQVLLRLLGPLFFGLALLSLRGRVRR
jgi:uncharacterized protein YjbI with pentapeptide repeats